MGRQVGDVIKFLTSLFNGNFPAYFRHAFDFRFYDYFAECKIRVKVNHEKTEALALGDNSLWEDLSNMHTLCNVIIKILGIHFGGNDKERDDLNFRETLKSIKKSRNL